MWTAFKVFIEFVIILLLLYVSWVFGHGACGIVVPQPGIETASPPLEGKALTADPPGKPPMDYHLWATYQVRTFQIVWGVAQAICIGIKLLGGAEAAGSGTTLGRDEIRRPSYEGLCQS